MPFDQPSSEAENRLQGSLAEIPLSRLLGECFAHQVTGSLHVWAGGRQGLLALRAGAVHRADFRGLRGEAALDALRSLRSGTFELVQALPPLGGTLGTGLERRGTTSQVPLDRVMRYCEEHALTCTITLILDFDRAVLVYRAGALVGVNFNGEEDEARIEDIVSFRGARFRIALPPLELVLEEPAPSQDPTVPVDMSAIVQAVEPEPTEPFEHELTGYFEDLAKPRERDRTGRFDGEATDLCDSDTTIRCPTDALFEFPDESTLPLGLAGDRLN